MPKLFYEITSLKKLNGKIIIGTRWLNEDSIDSIISKDCFEIIEDKYENNITRIYFNYNNDNMYLKTTLSREIIDEFCNYIVVSDSGTYLVYSIKTPEVPSFPERKPLVKEILESFN